MEGIRRHGITFIWWNWKVIVANRDQMQFTPLSTSFVCLFICCRHKEPKRELGLFSWIVFRNDIIVRWYENEPVQSEWQNEKYTTKTESRQVIQPENWLLKCNNATEIQKNHFLLNVYLNPCHRRMSWTISINISIRFVYRTSALFLPHSVKLPIDRQTQNNMTINFIN